MKGGIIASDQITAVSPTYKEEIQYEFFGEKLDGLLRKYNDKLSGIVNGIDTSVYNPETDSYITAQYDADSLYERMKINARYSVILVCQKKKIHQLFQW